MPWSRWTKKVRKSHECHLPYSGPFLVGSHWRCRCGQKWCVIHVSYGGLYTWKRS